VSHATVLLDPRASLISSTALEGRLSVDYLTIDSGWTVRRASTAKTDPRRDGLDKTAAKRAGVVLLERSLTFIEMLVVTTSCWEILHDAAQTIQQYGIGRLIGLIRTQTGLDVEAVAEAVADQLDLPTADAVDGSQLPSLSAMTIVQFVHAYLDKFPRSSADRILRATSRGDLRERLDAGLRQLQLFVLRHDEDLQDQIALFGELYVMGHIEIPQIAVALRLTIERCAFAPSASIA
jgi:hypothetical protein